MSEYCYTSQPVTSLFIGFSSGNMSLQDPRPVSPLKMTEQAAF